MYENGTKAFSAIAFSSYLFILICSNRSTNFKLDEGIIYYLWFTGNKGRVYLSFLVS